MDDTLLSNTCHPQHPNLPFGCINSISLFLIESIHSFITNRYFIESMRKILINFPFLQSNALDWYYILMSVWLYVLQLFHHSGEIDLVSRFQNIAHLNCSVLCCWNKTYFIWIFTENSWRVRLCMCCGDTILKCLVEEIARSVNFINYKLLVTSSLAVKWINIRSLGDNMLRGMSSSKVLTSHS